MTVRIAIENNKGGTGKSATAVGISSAIVHSNSAARVLLIDCDEQNNLRQIFGTKQGEFVGSMLDIIQSNVEASSCVHMVRKNIGLIQSGGRKLGLFIQKQLRAIMAENTDLLFVQRLSNLINWDYIILDCPPGFGEMSSNASIFADFVVIPVAPDPLSVISAKATVHFLDSIQQQYPNENVAKVVGVLPTLHDARRKMDTQIIEDIEQMIGHSVFHDAICLPEIRTDAKYTTSLSKRKLIHEVFPKSNVALDYSAATVSLLNHIGGKTTLTNFTKTTAREQELSRGIAQ